MLWNGCLVYFNQIPKWLLYKSCSTMREKNIYVKNDVACLCNDNERMMKTYAVFIQYVGIIIILLNSQFWLKTWNYIESSMSTQEVLNVDPSRIKCEMNEMAFVYLNLFFLRNEMLDQLCRRRWKTERIIVNVTIERNVTVNANDSLHSKKKSVREKKIK